MTQLYSEAVVCRELRIEPEVLGQFLKADLVQLTEVGGARGFTKSQLRLLWSITSLYRDLGVNIEGIRIILQMSADIRDLKLAVRESQRRCAQLEHLQQFRIRITEERQGPSFWEIDL
ncbi:hypothetical protein Pan216_05830 [Planctomycetes bacterium Pan216]|uniref:HTH merR-type domain-containing protein n=1 Tax=Kolteria novifilia TaxID=2527975 RepID=A0A518AYE7_9BACT|nr:hypothetical protein Pan216_05830 [Planctomycetes bacterium Pan216]